MSTEVDDKIGGSGIDMRTMIDDSLRRDCQRRQMIDARTKKKKMKECWLL